MNNEELCLKIQAGDAKAFEYLLSVNTAFIKHLAYDFKKKFSGMRPDVNDLIQEGVIGLFKAAKVYNPSLGNAFLTFASKVIENGMHDYIRSLRKYNDHEVLMLESSDATYKEVAFDLLLLNKADSFERLSIEDYASYHYSPEQIYLKKELNDRLYAALDAIPKRESTYLKYRYGFIDHYRSKEETAELFSLSESRAKMIEEQSLRDMREQLG